MKSEGLLYFTDIGWTTLALILFFSFFAILIFRVFFMADTKQIENSKYLVFNEDGVSDDNKR